MPTFDHEMLREIYEQPLALRHTLGLYLANNALKPDVAALLAGFCVLISTVPGAQAANPSGWNIINTPDTGSSTLLMGTACANAWECSGGGGIRATDDGNEQSDGSWADGDRSSTSCGKRIR